MEKAVLFSTIGSLGLITLNRPEALNALTLSMVEAIYAELMTWKDNQSIKAVVITATPGKAFCAGGDVRWLYAAAREEQLDFFKQEYRLNALIHNYPKPYIAMMNGITMGGGVGIALHGRYAMASKAFRFAMPETSIGFFPDIGASFLLARCPKHLGHYLGLSGRILDANDSYLAGLITHRIDAQHFPAVLDALTTAESDTAVQSILHSFADRHLIEGLEIPNALDNCFAHQSMEDILHALRITNTNDALTLAAELEKKSPLSLKITLEQGLKAKHLSFEHCLMMEYSMVQQSMREPDFYEGVRALLIDKDKTPHWQFSSLEAIDRSVVANYFKTMGDNFLEN